MLVGSEILEEFIYHIERDDLVRLRWLKRIRQSGFDQALSEYRQMVNGLRQSPTNVIQDEAWPMICHDVSDLT